MYDSRIISIRQHLRSIKEKVKFMNNEYMYESEDNNIAKVCYKLNEIKWKITYTKNQEQSAKSFPSKSKTLKQRNIATKKSIVTFTTNSKATLKLTQISVTDAQLTKA